jgi:hypothetical protein
LILDTFVFTITNLIREQVTEEVKVITKDSGVSVVEMPDHPRGIPNCKYNIGDTLIVSYTVGTEATLHTKSKVEILNDIIVIPGYY